MSTISPIKDRLSQHKIKIPVDKWKQHIHPTRSSGKASMKIHSHIISYTDTLFNKSPTERKLQIEWFFDEKLAKL
jgi:hypothetical protein